MSVYVIINLSVIAIPLVLSFDRKVAFFRRWPAVVASALVVGAAYIAWDVFAAARGDWGFNERYVGAFELFGLPLGELLFFFTVPYSCLFVWEVVHAYIRDRTFRMPLAVRLAPAAAAVILAAVFRKQDYTFLVMLSVAAFVLPAAWTPIFSSRNFWIFLALSLLAFLIVNGLLTALPVVVYGEEAIWGVRVYRIPLEDFFYCISLLGFNVLLYRLLRPKLTIRTGRPEETSGRTPEAPKAGA